MNYDYIKPEKSFIMKKFLMQNIYWIWSHASVVVMAVMLIIGPGTWKVLTSYSGYTAVGFLVATLLLNPLKTLRPQWMFITKLNRHRRELGVAAFAYAVIHIACFIIKREGFMNALPYALHPALLSVIYISFPIFLLLALTSNPYSVKRLGFPKWKKLHKKV
jgi:sulfoxide reductase heme-binding subunit YedZ